MSPLTQRPCPGCRRNLIAAPARRCPACTKAYDQRRGSSTQRGYNAQHRRWRELVLEASPDCVDCGAPGQPDDHADHIVPIAAGGEWSVENGARRCRRCHSRKTVTTDGGFGRPRASQAAPRGDFPGGGGPKRHGRALPRPPRAEIPTDVAAAYAREEDRGA